MSTLDSDLPLPADEPNDDVAHELEEIRRRRRIPRMTLVLTVALAGAGAFIGGAEAQKHLGSSTSSSNGSAAAGGLASRFRSSGSGKAANANGGVTFGTVTAIKGSTLYVTDASGNTIKVATSPASQVSKTVTGSVKDAHPGDTVVVTGTKRANGTIDARSISLGGGGLGGFVGGGSSSGGATGFGFNGSGSKGGG